MGKFKYGVGPRPYQPKHPDEKVMNAGAMIALAWPKPPSKEMLKPKPKIERFMKASRKAGLFRVAKIMALNVKRKMA